MPPKDPDNGTLNEAFRTIANHESWTMETALNVLILFDLTKHNFIREKMSLHHIGHEDIFLPNSDGAFDGSLVDPVGWCLSAMKKKIKIRDDFLTLVIEAGRKRNKEKSAKIEREKVQAEATAGKNESSDQEKAEIKALKEDLAKANAKIASIAKTKGENSKAEPEPKPEPLPQGEPEDGFLPAPAGTTWNKVGMTITQNAQIKIGVNGETQLYDLDKFKARVVTQKKPLEYLFLIISSGGVLTREATAISEDKAKFRTNVSRLRKMLQKAFGIITDPLPHQQGRYQAQFSVSSEITPQH